MAVSCDFPTLEPADWDGEDRAAPMLIDRLDAVFRAESVTRWHLYGCDSPELDFSFGVPEPLLRLKPEARQANKNFTTLGARHFLRALLPIPVVGGELRIGTWFEVAALDFQSVYDAWDAPEYLGVKVRGRVANTLRLDGVDLLGEEFQLAPRTADECLFVDTPRSRLAEQSRRARA